MARAACAWRGDTGAIVAVSCATSDFRCGSKAESWHLGGVSVVPREGDFDEVSLTRRRSYKFDDPDLSFRVGFDVTLRGPKVRVTGQHLDVTERPADRRDLPRGIGDESASAAVTRTAVEADVPVPSPEQVDDGLRRHSPRPFALDQEGAGRHPDRFGILTKCGP